MEDSEYTVERSIENITFPEKEVEEVRERVRHEMIDAGETSLDEEEVEQRVQERLVDIARDRTLNEQGDNRLHNDINHSLTVQDRE